MENFSKSCFSNWQAKNRDCKQCSLHDKCLKEKHNTTKITETYLDEYDFTETEKFIKNITEINTQTIQQFSEFTRCVDLETCKIVLENALHTKQ